MLGSLTPESGSQRADRSASAGKRRLIVFAVLAVVVLAAVTWVLVNQSRTRVKWTSVMEAANAASTVNAVARVSGDDGTEWAYSLWVRVDGPGSFSPRGMLIPVKVPKGARPSAQVLAATQAMDYCGIGGVAASLAKKGRTSRGTWTEWGGSRMLEVTLGAAEVPDRSAGSPDRWRFYLEPRTRLVQGLDIFVGNALRASAVYRYNQPLPPGFESEGPGAGSPE